MSPDLIPVVKSFIEREKLPEEYFRTVEQWFLPMLEEILEQVASHHGTCVIGVSGSQGSGKSTLASLLVSLLDAMMGLRCISLSIDDFYLTHAQRQRLGDEVHPLLVTRGVPGTHDVKLAINTVNALKGEGEVSVPRFDKAVDDRIPEANWPVVRGPVDVIVLEGWCLSVNAQPEALLADPVNALEAKEDAEGKWRKYVNDAIDREYGELYDMVDFLIMLKAPGFDKVFEWRQNQEGKLAESQQAINEEHSRIMTAEQLQRFVQHYERVTRYGLETLPEKADVVFQLTDRQTIAGRL